MFACCAVLDGMMAISKWQYRLRCKCYYVLVARVGFLHTDVCCCCYYTVVLLLSAFSDCLARAFLFDITCEHKLLFPGSLQLTPLLRKSDTFCLLALRTSLPTNQSHDACVQIITSALNCSQFFSIIAIDTFCLVAISDSGDQICRLEDQHIPT